MGYSHYWSREQILTNDPAAFAAYAKDVGKVIAASGVVIVGPYDAPNAPVLTGERVALNGDARGRIYRKAMRAEIPSWYAGYTDATERRTKIAEARAMFAHATDEHEDFIVSRIKGPHEYGSTKTAHKPYDIVVVAALILLAHHFPEAVTLQSDGKQPDWEAGLALAIAATDKPLMIPPEILTWRQHYLAMLARYRAEGRAADVAMVERWLAELDAKEVAA